MSELLKPHQHCDVEEAKEYYARMFKQGYPVILYPHLVKDAEAVGMQEGVHFLVSRPMPLG